jgi:hypothetical protein
MSKPKNTSLRNNNSNNNGEGVSGGGGRGDGGRGRGGGGRGGGGRGGGSGSPTTRAAAARSKGLEPQLKNPPELLLAAKESNDPASNVSETSKRETSKCYEENLDPQELPILSEDESFLQGGLDNLTALLITKNTWRNTQTCVLY